MMPKYSRVLLAAASFLLPFFSQSFAQAAISPLGLAIFPPLQFPPEDFTVALARVNVFWGQHQRVYGFDIGVIGSVTDVNFAGIAVAGVFNFNKGMSTIIGLQLAGITNVNVNKANIYGLQLAAGLNSNQAESTHIGAQLALINNSPFTHLGGVQVGLYNRALTVTGFQIGLINDTENLHGLQIGLINFHRKGLFYVAPILNFGF